MAVSIRTIVNSINSVGYTGSEGVQGNQGDQGFSPGIRLYFDASSTTGGVSADGSLRINASATADATAIYINVNNTSSQSISGWLAALDDGTNPNSKGQLSFNSETVGLYNFAVFRILSITNNTTYYTINVTYLSGVNFVANEPITALFARAGDFGYSGSFGFTGSRGFTGSAGPQGFTGSASTTIGFTGSQGAGFTGSASTVVGFSGSVGFTGSQGAGFTGSTGYTGSGGLGYTGSEGAGFTGSASTDIGFTGSAGTSPVTLQGFQPHKASIPVAAQVGNGTIFLDPIDIPVAINLDRIAYPMVFTTGAANNGTLNMTVDIGIYTKNGSTLSSLHATRFATTYTVSTSGYSSYGGVRMFTVPWTTTITGGEYVFAFRSSTSAQSTNLTISNFVASNLASTLSGNAFEASNVSAQRTAGLGIYSVASASLPSAISLADIRGGSSAFQRPPIFYLTSYA